MHLTSLTLPRAFARSLMRDRCELRDTDQVVIWTGRCHLETRDQKWVVYDLFESVQVWHQEYRALLPLDAPRTGWNTLRVTSSRGQLAGESFRVRGRPADTLGAYQSFWVGRMGGV